MESQIKKMTVVNLRKELSKAGLTTSGLKADLVERLLKYKQSESLENGKEDSDSTSTKNKRKAEEEGEEDEPSFKRSKSKNGSHSILKRSGSIYEVDSSYERVREGPPEAFLVKLPENNSLVLSKKNLEVSNSNSMYQCDYAVGNIRVNAGKWYYEIKINQSGQIQFGWCSATFDPQKGGNFWAYDTNKQQKVSNIGGDSERYGESCQVNDIFGCSLDVEVKTVQFWKNGKDMGIAFTNVAPEPGNRLVPYIALARRASILVSFGKDKFIYPQEGYNPLHCFLSEKEISKLSKLFDHYRDLSGPGEPTQGEDGIEKLFGNGLEQFQNDLRIIDEEDPSMFITFWKLNCKIVWQISRSDFMNGWTVHGCFTIDQMMQKIKEWKEELRTNDIQFKKFYNFSFDYLKEEKTSLSIEEAIVLWNIILKEKKWRMYQDWLDFLKVEKKKAISRDAWQQLWHFVQAFPNTIKEYDSSSSWPIIFDDFVDWMKTKEKK